MENPEHEGQLGAGIACGEVVEVGLVETDGDVKAEATLLALDQIGHVAHQHGGFLRLGDNHMVDRVVG